MRPLGTQLMHSAANTIHGSYVKTIGKTGVTSASVYQSMFTIQQGQLTLTQLSDEVEQLFYLLQRIVNIYWYTTALVTPGFSDPNFT